MARSGSGMSAIFASTSLSPSALCARGPRRAAAFSSWTRSFIAVRSSSVNPLDALPGVLLADCCVPFFAGFLSVMAKRLRAPSLVSYCVAYFDNPPLLVPADGVQRRLRASLPSG